MYEAALALNIKDFMKYFDAMAAGDPPVAKRVAQAKELLETFLKKAEGNTFSKDDAQEFQAMLTKGIGDWSWPAASAKEIDARITNLCALAYAEEIAK